MKLKESIIRRADQTEISYDDFEREILSEAKSDSIMAVGSDSQVFPKYISFVTCICIHTPGLGGRFFFIKNKNDSKPFSTMRLRIMNEVFLSMEIAGEVNQIIPKDIEIHIDIGSDEKKSKTSKFCKEFIGMVNSSGYKCEIKPFSWASHVADKFTKS